MQETSGDGRFVSQNIEIFTPLNKDISNVSSVLIMDHVGVLRLWKWMQQLLLNNQYLRNNMHGFISQKTWLIISTILRTSNLACFQPVWFVSSWAPLSFPFNPHELLLPAQWAQTCFESLCMQTFVTFYRFCPNVIHISLSLSKLYPVTPLRYLVLPLAYEDRVQERKMSVIQFTTASDIFF